MINKTKTKSVIIFLIAATLTGLFGCQPSIPERSVVIQSKVDESVAFDDFQYEGMDSLFEQPLDAEDYRNPVVAGFFPDPSITRKGDDYYMVHSSFAYAPGVPVLHSTDLVNWKIIGHALNSEKQLNLNAAQVSRGIFAPTIRYHDGLFYMITTAVDAGGNFFVTAEDPAGPWSEPYWLPEIGGIDPDIFFDDSGKVYIAHNDAPEGEPLYDGHRAIWLWEYDLAAKQVVAGSGRVIVNGGVDLSKQPVWIEGPHLYKINGWYYLLCAEGGTADEHSEVVFRSRDLSQPFEPYENNPILTQRTLAQDRTDPVTTAGHADLVQTQNGQWWAVFLAARAYDKRFYNTGRETFLLPVRWQNEWPLIWPENKPIAYQLPKPAGLQITANSEPLTGNFVWRDEFENKTLSPHWLRLRGFDDSWYHTENGMLMVQPKTVRLADMQQPALLVRRQQHGKFITSTLLKLPVQQGIDAGLVLMQNEKYHYFIGVRKAEQGFNIFVEQASGQQPVEQFSTTVDMPDLTQLRIIAFGDEDKLRFSYQINDTSIALGKNWDGRILSTQVAGGFVGTMIGVHARRTLD